MREIKFRAWHKTLNKMFSAEKMAEDQLTLLPTGKFINVSGVSTKLSKIYDEMIPMQFIGLHDKNGKEIYEGDIVNFAVKKKICSKCHEGDLEYSSSKFCPDCGAKVEKIDFVTTSQVVFTKGGFAYEYNRTEYEYQSWHTYTAAIYIEWAEIIGNIYEHPELLKETPAEAMKTKDDAAEVTSKY